MQRHLVLASAVLLPVAAAAGAQPVRGIFALQGGTADAMGYLLAPQIGDDPLYRRLNVWMTPRGSDVTIRSYRVDMTKLLHMIIVTDDFRIFLHVHPVPQPDGHFLLDQRLPGHALYLIYADAEPQGIGHTVFRFDLNLDGPRSLPRDLSERGTTSRAGPYVVRISTDALSARPQTRLVVHILEGNVPATDLHPYLGALAHAVFLNAGDLSYAHVHPMPLSAESPPSNSSRSRAAAMKPLPASAISSPDMQLHVSLREPGTYKLWLQFRGGAQLYVAPFVVTVES